MRTEKELWEVVLSRPDLFTHGLCSWIKYVKIEDLISAIEYRFLAIVLETHLPPRKYSMCPSLPLPLDYCFPYKELQPRIDWIKNRIEEL